ncbi:hypothetical protein L249_8336 [Ophiocordyceps polyrhachis-furcata BCC 54312]|uniref:Uncharacterized protein n=1 Tax=Ophiocordyceps polyrhachis-furcata BCC 54312 TaxID=1330021 RepID=A0A367KYU7_9HYPO|nr:hypothetical protein L249_4489 [Ophiocordyceps polyrhachis-furcata BCC 54312]RCI07508.1 hypothetical protein L249_8336 [Ophiocordyceps polyrhachis-furcata BCC 54312]
MAASPPSQVTDYPRLTDTPPPEFSTTMPRFQPTPDIPRTISSDNIIIRQFKNTDYDAYMGLLSAPLLESHPHFSIDFTPFALLVPSPFASDPHYFGVFLSTPDNEEGELIGSGGECTFCTSLPHISYPSLSNWPTLGFKFKREYMDRDYATEFILTFLEFCAALEGAGFDYIGPLDNTRKIWRNWRRDYSAALLRGSFAALVEYSVVASGLRLRLNINSSTQI